MTTHVNMAVVDDQAMHRGVIKNMLDQLGRESGNFTFNIVAEFEDGQQCIDGITAANPDMVTMDLRMPNVDGLTAVLLLRRKGLFDRPIVVVSSESEENFELHRVKAVSPKIAAMSFEEKLGLMAKIEERVLAGVKEEGKINDLLNGCQTLDLNPVRYSIHIGANGFLHKPYKIEQVQAMVPEVLNGKTFINA